MGILFHKACYKEDNHYFNVIWVWPLKKICCRYGPGYMTYKYCKWHTVTVILKLCSVSKPFTTESYLSSESSLHRIEKKSLRTRMTQCLLLKAYITILCVNNDLPRLTSGLSLILVVGAVSWNCNFFSTTLSTFSLRLTSIRWIRFLSALECLFTNSNLTNINDTRANEITEIARDILFILSPDFVWLFLFAAIPFERTEPAQ